MYLILHKISKTGISILDISLEEIGMNHIRAVHVKLYDDSNRTWLLWATARIHPFSSARLRVQSACGEHWWSYIGVDKSIPYFRGVRLPTTDTWSPTYEPLP